MNISRNVLLAAATCIASSCGSTSGNQNDARSTAAGEAPAMNDSPVPGAINVDHLIQPGEKRFKRLWLVAQGGENAEAYWSFSGDRLVLQRRSPSEGVECDQIYVTGADGLTLQSTGKGVTTCAYFLPGDASVLFASTHAEHETCPTPPDRSKGYVWPLHAEYDIYVRDLESRALRTLVGGPGYDAEATVAPTGDRIVFTSTRSGDIELWTCALDGSDLRQVTDTPGYDGGAFFSHDGKKLIWRSTAFAPDKADEQIAEYRALLAEGLVRPSAMELQIANADGTDRRQITNLGRANFAPFFTPDDRHVLFSTNHHDDSRRGGNFDIFMIATDGTGLEQVTHFNEGDGKQFDGFPMFSPDGRFLAFSSNRGDTEPGETNVYVAEWQ